ncbi:hypothetical protein P280DRAFT_509913 [Massarina eburnea CBS 473.64]|uniref:Adhesin domain-containing protein n=1 Tax=Massarina eburnea CBS 473.64 TaxID=1395130 RepID=A0A6A6RQ09_9PLEO|nr:hypothetical protein P280DRAFT_509913 [Massarina eburnea CBS 473.64]
MFIDTEAANRGQAPRVKVTAANGSLAYEDEGSPLMETFVGQDAPPSYLEATTPMPWGQGGEGSRLLEEGRVSVAFTPMREEHKDGKYRRRGCADSLTKKRVFVGLLAIIAIIVVSVIIAALAGRQKEREATPIAVPAQPASSSIPLLPGKPTKPHGKQTFPIRWPSHCGKNNYNVKSEGLNFGSPSSLTIHESIQQLDGPYKRVSGWIHVAPAPSDQAAGTIQAKMSYAVTDTIDVNSIKYEYRPDGLTIGDPTLPDGLDEVNKGSACLGVSVTLYVAAGAKIDNLNIRSSHLGMQVHNGVNFAVTNTTDISLTTGTLDSVSFNSRETHLRTISGSISGKYSLFDLVSIETKSGSVNVNIQPKEAVEGSSPSAVFTANSISGSVRADFERKKIPQRDYQVSINTTVGSVDGTFIHGSRTELMSVEGQINADLLPYSSTSTDEPSILTTKTTDGQTLIKVHSPYHSRKTNPSMMNKMVSTHTSISGAVDLKYPQEWSGHLEGQSFNGTVHLQGKDLELLKQEEREGFNLVEAKKGNGGSTMVFGTVSGGCEVKVGKSG